MMPSDDLGYLEPVDYEREDFGQLFDELPLWSAPFGLRLLERVPLPRQGTILDLGAGTGFLSLEMAQRCGPGVTVLAVDPWAAAARRLRDKVERLGLPNVRVIEQDAATLELPPASVDLALSNLGVNNFDNAAAVLARCAEALKPGAALLLTTNLVGHMREFYEIFRATLQAEGLAEALPGLDAHVAHRATPAGLREQLGAAGLEPGECETDTFRLRYADGSAFLRHHFIRLGFLPAWKALVPAEAVPRFFPALEAALNARAAERGELALTVPLACLTARRPATSRSSPSPATPPGRPPSRS